MRSQVALPQLAPFPLIPCSFQAVEEAPVHLFVHFPVAGGTPLRADGASFPSTVNTISRRTTPMASSNQPC